MSRVMRMRFNPQNWDFAIQNPTGRWTTFRKDGWPDGTYETQDVMKWEGWVEIPTPDQIRQAAESLGKISSTSLDGWALSDIKDMLNGVLGNPGTPYRISQYDCRVENGLE